MSALLILTTVTFMLNAAIRWDLTSVLANPDFLEMERNAKVVLKFVKAEIISYYRY